MSEAALKAIVDKLEKITSRLEKLEGSQGSAPAAAAPSSGNNDNNASAAVSAYQALIDEHLVPFAAVAEKLGGDVAPLAQLVKDAAEAQKALIDNASKSKKPANDALPKVLAALSARIASIGAYRDNNRATENKNNLWAVAEGSSIFGWVAVSPTPGPYAKELIGSAEFYTNKILREFKGKDADQVSFATHWTGFLKALVPYIKQYHTTGLSWNPRGGEAAVADAPAPKAAAAAPKKVVIKKPAGAPATGGLFAELNKGGNITSGLKKVKREETNKGKKISGKVTAPVRVKKVVATKPPVLELQGNKWIIEYQVNTESPIVLSDVKRNQTVYIFKCQNAVIMIEGKVNSICIDNCKKTGLVFDNAVSTCEVVNCQSVQVQIKGKVPALSIDKTGGAKVYLSNESLDTEIVTGTSSEMNVILPPKDETSDPIELPVPEQFRTVVKDGKLVTAQVDHSGG